MNSETLKLYKLIILYFLHKAKQDITNAILSDFILEYGYTDYFSIQQTLTALEEDNMIRAHKTHTTSYYTITEQGAETLIFFCSQLPYDTQNQIDDYLKRNKIQIVEDTSIRTDYTQSSPTDYLVRCSLVEHNRILAEVALNVPSESDAIDACGRFKEKSEEIYSFLLQTLGN